jgi:hypothetical protein
MQFQKESTMAYRRSARDGTNEEPHASGTTSRDDGDPLSDVRERLKTLLNSRDFDEVDRLLSAYTASAETETEADGDIDRPLPGQPRYPQPGDRRRADDHRLVLAMDAHPDSARGIRAREQAIDKTAPIVGRDVVVAADSAAGVFRRALRAMGYDSRHIDASALPEIFNARSLARFQSGGSNVASVAPLAADMRGSSMPANVRRAISRIRVV